MRERPWMMNPPIRVEFAGLQGTTHSLGNKGWQLAVEEGFDPHSMQYMLRIAGYHPQLQLKIMSRPAGMDNILREAHSGDWQFWQHLPPIQIMFVAKELYITIPCDRMPQFQPVDHRPQLDWMDKRFSLRDICLFKPIQGETEIIVPEPSIPNLLSLILEKQKPLQDEIRDRNRRRDAREEFYRENNIEPAKDVKIQVVSLRNIA